MKIGILTFHSQINYGGVLQAYALQKTLQDWGHEVYIIDYHLPFFESFLRNLHKSLFSIKGFLNDLLACGQKIQYVIRWKRTEKFIKEQLHLKIYFSENPLAEYDLVILGSDQIWNPDYISYPNPFMLEGISNEVPCLSYAASFGIAKLHGNQSKRYYNALKKFDFISCRENEGVEIVKSLGLQAEHVVDPVLLLAPEAWNKIIRKGASAKKSTKKIVCYFLGMFLDEYIEKILDFVQQNHVSVDIFVHDLAWKSVSLRSFIKIKKRISLIRKYYRSDVCLRFSASPEDFISALSTSDGVVTNSFHGLMFSYIFDRNVRIFSSNRKNRANIFGRLGEFWNASVKNIEIASSLEDALYSLFKEPYVAFDKNCIFLKRKKSLKWLQSVIDESKKK